ncbi:MAG: PAS domain-containing protein, partial [Acidobacteriota bacterium]
MGRSSTPFLRVPAWVATLGTAAWASDPRRRVVFLNRDAERLLGISSDEACGLPCDQLIGGKDENGRSLCGPRCPLLLAEEADRAARPRRMRILGASGDERWLRVLPISIRDDQP